MQGRIRGRPEALERVGRLERFPALYDDDARAAEKRLTDAVTVSDARLFHRDRQASMR